MTDHAKNLRSTRADMIGTDDEQHYWDCHKAADYIEELEDRGCRFDCRLRLKDAFNAGYYDGLDRKDYSGDDWTWFVDNGEAIFREWMSDETRG